MSNEVLVHGFMKYRCNKCGKEWNMYLEKGIEEHGDDHKPSPFCIKCMCGGTAQDVSGKIKLHGYSPINNKMSYFANEENSDCGVPIVK